MESININTSSNIKHEENEMELNIECHPTHAIQNEQCSSQSIIATTSSAVIADGNVSAETELSQFSPPVGILKCKLKQDSDSEELLEDTDEKRSKNISSSTQDNNKPTSSSLSLSPSSYSSLEALRSHNNLDELKHQNNDATNSNTKDHEQKLNEALNSFLSLDDLTKNKFLSNVMEEHANYRRIILELIITNYFKEYIDHCIRENPDSIAAKKILCQNVVKQCTSNNNEYNEICEHLLNECTDVTTEWLVKFVEIIVARKKKA